jgi:hypothetical protein
MSTTPGPCGPGPALADGDIGRSRGCWTKSNASDPPGRAPRRTERRATTSRWAHQGNLESRLAHPTDRMLGCAMGWTPKVREQVASAYRAQLGRRRLGCVRVGRADGVEAGRRCLGVATHRGGRGRLKRCHQPGWGAPVPGGDTLDCVRGVWRSSGPSRVALSGPGVDWDSTARRCDVEERASSLLGEGRSFAAANLTYRGL